MANTITIKSSIVPGAIPSPNQLSTSELAFNAVDNKLWIKNNAGSVVDLTSAACINAGVLPIQYGGTGTSSQNFVDISTNQNNIGGNKSFSGSLSIGNNTTIDTSGNLTISGSFTGSNISKFRVYKNTPQTVSASINTKISYQVETYDSKMEFDLGSNRFIAQAAGTYLFTVGTSLPALSSSTRIYVMLYINNIEHSRLCDLTLSNPTNGTIPASNITVPLNTGDYVEVYINSSRSIGIPSGAALTFFSGVRLH